MSGRVLLDTNVIIALFSKDQVVIKNLAKTEEVFVSSIVLGELYYGAESSSRVSENVSRIDAFVHNSAVLRCDESTAKYYGQIKRQLKVKGTPIPENDIWIAATAIHFGLTLITRDNHFVSVDNLNIEQW